jgi:hypothetical protein
MVPPWQLVSGRRAFAGVPRLRFVFADGGFAGRLLDWAQQFLATTLQIVRKPAGQQELAVNPRRWAVKRTQCAARRSVVSPVQPGGIWREVPGPPGFVAV